MCYNVRVNRRGISGTAKGIVTWVRYKDPKGKEKDCVKWVNWE